MRMDNVGFVVDDMSAAVGFLGALGMELEGEATVEGREVDALLALEGVRSDVAMMRTPDGQRIELSRFEAPEVLAGDPRPPMNTLGFLRVMFAVDDIEAVLARLREHGGELVGELVRYGDSHRLCYVRGPAGITVALAEALS